ncbi:unnamed protein product, partial [Rotaria socialis]
MPFFNVNDWCTAGQKRPGNTQKRPSIHRRETGQAYLGAHSTYRPHIDLPVVCSIHARYMPVREESWLSMAPPSSIQQFNPNGHE